MRNIIAFGDIHGCYKAAATAVLLAEEKQAQAIFLGDYVDRGPSAVQTIRILMKAKENHPDWVFLRGNHDQMLLDLTNGKAQIGDDGAVLNMNFDYNQTAKSYEEWKQVDALEQASIVKFINETKFYHETENYIFCHAILNNDGCEIHEKTAEILMWNYQHDPKWEGKTFVHGHYPVKHLSFYNQGININTECGYGGSLTGLVLCESENKLILYRISENGIIVNTNSLYFK